MFKRVATVALAAGLAAAACSGGGSSDKIKIGGGFALTGDE